MNQQEGMLASYAASSDELKEATVEVLRRRATQPGLFHSEDIILIMKAEHPTLCEGVNFSYMGNIFSTAKREGMIVPLLLGADDETGRMLEVGVRAERPKAHGKLLPVYWGADFAH